MLYKSLPEFVVELAMRLLLCVYAAGLAMGLHFIYGEDTRYQFAGMAILASLLVPAVSLYLWCLATQVAKWSAKKLAKNST